MTYQEQLIYANMLINKGNAILTELQSQAERTSMLDGIENIDIQSINEQKMSALIAIEVTEAIAIERAKTERMQ